MPKFRKKPLVIEAEQWFPGKQVEGAKEWREPSGEVFAEVESLEGTLIATPGDWIITGIQGEKYVCRNDIFRASYDPCEPRAWAAIGLGPRIDKSFSNASGVTT